MTPAKRKAVESAGFRVGNAAEFLGLSDDESLLIDLRLAVSRAVRRLRESSGATQSQLAGQLKSSQSRIAKLEAASADVSLDLMFRAFFAVGGRLDDLARAMQPASEESRSARRPSPRRIASPAAATARTRKKSAAS